MQAKVSGKWHNLGSKLGSWDFPNSTHHDYELGTIVELRDTKQKDLYFNDELVGQVEKTRASGVSEMQEPKVELAGREVRYTDCWGEVEEITFAQWFARAFVVAHLHHKGKFREFLTTEQAYECYKLADGFGPWDSHLEKYFEGGWDWSHIRDSSWEAHEQIAEYIIAEKWVDADLAAKVQQCFDWAEQLNLSPLEFVP